MTKPKRGIDCKVLAKAESALVRSKRDGTYACPRYNGVSCCVTCEWRPK